MSTVSALSIKHDASERPPDTLGVIIARSCFYLPGNRVQVFFKLRSLTIEGKVEVVNLTSGEIIRFGEDTKVDLLEAVLTVRELKCMGK